MEPWYKVVTPRTEVREGRSFNPDEFAIALEQVVAGTAPDDYTKPEAFFRRNVFTSALKEHAGKALRRLAGETESTSPVMTLVTQFGGGKTHTLTALYHLAAGGDKARTWDGVHDLLFDQGIRSLPESRVAVFVGNAWDPQPGKETPWIDLARQIAGEPGVAALGTAALTTAPGTEALGRVFDLAGKPVLILADEVLNFVGRHRAMADAFYAFIQNLTVAATGRKAVVAVISLPRSHVFEMTEWDIQWQEKIKKVVRRVAEDLISTDESEISNVIRRRLFEDLGDERKHEAAATAYAEWCFARRAQLAAEWTTVDSATSEAQAKDVLRRHFLDCYPFHPSTLTVFQRKWRTLPQYQQTRGTLAMLAQWVSLAMGEAYKRALNEPLLTLGSAPLWDPRFRSAVLGQLGEERLEAAIAADISSETSHAKALDVDTKGPLKDIHRRVASAIFFESSGGQVEKLAHLPELRFAVGGPDLDTTSIDNAADALENKCYFMRKVGGDGYKIGHQPTLKKVHSDRKAALDPEREVRPAIRNLVKSEFEKDRRIPLVFFPTAGTDVPSLTKLGVVVMDPDTEWGEDKALQKTVGEWTRNSGSSPRLFPAALVWCAKKPGRELRSKVEDWLAWKRVKADRTEGILGSEFSQEDTQKIDGQVRDAEADARDEVWASYRYLAWYDAGQPEGVRALDIGSGHASQGETLTGRALAALRMNSLLSETVGSGFLDRHWPETFKASGAWPLDSLRQCFLNGSLTRLLDPDLVLTAKIPEFVAAGEMGLAYGPQPDGTYSRLWFAEILPSGEIAFTSDVFLLRKEMAQQLRSPSIPAPTPLIPGEKPTPPQPDETPAPEAPIPVAATGGKRRIVISGLLPVDSWNRVGTKLIPKLRGGGDVSARIELTAEVESSDADRVCSEIREILDELGVAESVNTKLE